MKVKLLKHWFEDRWIFRGHASLAFKEWHDINYPSFNTKGFFKSFCIEYAENSFFMLKKSWVFEAR